MSKSYSVLMSVYIKENPIYLREAMMSIYYQTIPTGDFVLVCDGPLTSNLEDTINEMRALFGNALKVHRLEKNVGLGNALNFGLSKCKNELVARMDSDDISLPERIEKQLAIFEKHPEISIVSSVINEFQDSPALITGKRMVPERHEEIVSFSKSRNPFNHPSVLFKKSHIEEVGGYSEEFHLFEDYYLWIRLLLAGKKGYNVQKPELLMRVPSQLYLRRGGWRYAKDLLRFNQWMLRKNWIGYKEYLLSAIPHAIVCVLPNFIRKMVYQLLHS